MKKLIIGLVIGTLFSFDLPKSWVRAGSHPEQYEMGIDKGVVGPDGSIAVTIQSNTKKTKGFGTLMQSCMADKFLGKKIKMTGYVKSKDVKGWAGLWLRVDSKASSAEVMGFDNMQDRPIRKTTDWTKYEIIMDVPAGANNLAYGALLVRQGQIWLSKISFEIIGDATPGAGKKCNVCSDKLNEPANLNFEQ